MFVILTILAFSLILCMAFLFLLKRDIALLNKKLQTIKQMDTNMRLTTETFDQDICLLCDTINGILDKQKSILTASEKSTREFRQAITNISHDLRTPLTSAIGYVQMIKSDKTPEDKKQEYLNVIEQRLQFLAILMDELFEYTQIIEGKSGEAIEKVNLCNVLRDTVSSFYESFLLKDFELQLSIPDAPIYIFCEPNSLRRIVQNLIQNVLTHGTELFKVIIDGENHRIVFQNKISNRQDLDVNRLFDRFYTADLSRTAGTTGLGLTIANELAQKMGCKMDASIDGDGELLSISLSFPQR